MKVREKDLPGSKHESRQRGKGGGEGTRKHMHHSSIFKSSLKVKNRRPILTNLELLAAEFWYSSILHKQWGHGQLSLTYKMLSWYVTFLMILGYRSSFLQNSGFLYEYFPRKGRWETLRMRLTNAMVHCLNVYMKAFKTLLPHKKEKNKHKKPALSDPCWCSSDWKGSKNNN